MALTKHEAWQLQDAGTEMNKLPKELHRGLHPGFHKAFYLLLSDCGNLDPETNLCNDYDNRPVICREFVVDSLRCEMIRERQMAAHVVDLPMPTVPVRVA